MNYPPTDNLPLDQEQLTPELRAQISQSQSAQSLQNAWAAVRSQIETAPSAHPAAGFSQRWRANLAEKRAMQQIMLARRLFLGVVTASLLSVATLGLVFLLSASPAGLMVTALRVITQSINWVTTARYTIAAWMQVIPLSVPIAVWFFFISGFSLISLAWVLVLWQTRMQGVAQK